MAEEKSMAEEMKLRCGVYGEGIVFSVEIKRNADVEALQNAIVNEKKDVNVHFKVDPATLTLYLARKESSAWVADDDNLDTLLRRDVDAAYKKMRSSWKLNKKELFGPSFTPGDKAIHVLVELPTKKTHKWSPEELSTVDAQVQSKLWKSVVRVSSEDVCAGTALVVDRTATHVYLLTNLRLWLDQTFTKDLSAEFKIEIQRFLRQYPRLKRTKRKAPADAKQPSRKSRRLSSQVKKTVDNSQVVIEQLHPDGKTLEEVLRFRLNSGVCWHSSATFDLAIFKVIAPQDIELTPCKMSIEVYPPMHVYVFSFPGALQDHKFDHPYAIIPAEVTEWNQNQMTLSAPGLSESAIVCTKRGVLVGYIGRGFNVSVKNEQYQSYIFTLEGIPPDLPSRLPSVERR